VLVKSESHINVGT